MFWLESVTKSHEESSVSCSRKRLATLNKNQEHGVVRNPQEGQKSTVSFHAEHRERIWREQAAAVEMEPSPWNLGTVPLSATDLHRALGVSLAVVV